MTFNSQQQEPGAGPGTPQSGATVPGSPNPLEPLPNPMKAQGQQPSRDWEASFNGLMTRYQADRREWETERTQLTEQLQQIAERLTGLEKARPQEPPPTKSQGKSPASDDDDRQAAPKDDALLTRLIEMEAERHRDNLLIEYSQPGQPGEGLRLFFFRENIPAYAPDTKDDGSIDDTAQRKAIETFIGKIKGAQTQTQKQAMAGWTPGSSPGAPQPPTIDDKIAQYEKVAALYAGSDEFMAMTPDQQRAVEKQYYDLIAEVGDHIPGISRPWMSADQLGTSVNQLIRRMGLVENEIKSRRG